MAVTAYLFPGFGEDRDMCRDFADELTQYVPEVSDVQVADYYNRATRREVDLEGADGASTLMAQLAFRQFGSLPPEFDVITHSYGDTVAQAFVGLSDETIRNAVRVAPAGVLHADAKLVPRFIRNLLAMMRDSEAAPFALRQIINIIRHPGAAAEAFEMCRAQGYTDDFELDVLGMRARETLILTLGRDVVFRSADQAQYGRRLGSHLDDGQRPRPNVTTKWALDNAHSDPFIRPAEAVAKIRDFYYQDDIAKEKARIAELLKEEEKAKKLASRKRGPIGPQPAEG